MHVPVLLVSFNWASAGDYQGYGCRFDTFVFDSSTLELRLHPSNATAAGVAVEDIVLNMDGGFFRVSVRLPMYHKEDH